jgi:serine phosphatase RsbU (regulator of sigma subunit)/anti-sigma regulatory factor (Ser/Thr protein kinase)
VKQDVTARREAEQILSENAKRLQQELDLAQQVQANLLPDSLPSLEGYELAALALPARFVSGDLYDWHLADSTSCSLVMADISGKGVPAAMLASAARVLLHSAQSERTDPAALLMRVASLLHEDLERAGMFITLFAARLDAARGRLTYANAGHTEGLLMRGAGGACERLPATGMPIGISREALIGEASLALRPGDTLLLYSDGVTEASSPGDELFGIERLIGLLSRDAGESAEGLVRGIGRTVADHCGGASLSDDLTVIAVKALPRLLAFAYPATLDLLGEATAFLRDASAIYGEAFSAELELACSELFTNIVQHAYRGREGEVRGLLSLRPEGVKVEIWDDGAPFDPALLPPTELGQLRESGYGLHIVRRLTDTLAYAPATERGNRWTIEKSMGGDRT